MHNDLNENILIIWIIFTGVWHGSVVQYSNTFSGSSVYIYLVVPLVAKLSCGEIIQGGCIVSSTIHIPATN